MCVYSYVLRVAESELAENDIGYLSGSVLNYLSDLPSPVVPAAVYPDLQAAVTAQQQLLLQSTGQ